MIISFIPSSPRYILEPFFTSHISSEHSDTKILLFRHTNQEKTNFVRDLSLSQQHTHKFLELVLPALLHIGHKQTFKWSNRWKHELKVKTYIKQTSCDTKFFCFNPFTRRYNTSRQGGGMVVPNCLHGKRDSAHLGDRKCVNHFTPLAQCTVGDLVLILTIFDKNLPAE